MMSLSMEAWMGKKRLEESSHIQALFYTVMDERVEGRVDYFYRTLKKTLCLKKLTSFLCFIFCF